MKNTLKRIFSIISFIATMGMLSGCSNPTGGSSFVGGDIDDPEYASTSITAQEIPSVRSEYLGKTVAVIPYVNKTLSEYRHLGDASVGILPEYLLEAGFQPIESSANSDFESVITELKYGQSGRVNPATAANIGEQLGAKYVFVGGVNNYRVIKPNESQNLNLPIPGIGGFSLGSGGAKITYDLQVSGRLIDVETRAIVASKTVSHKESFVLEGGNISTPWGSYSGGGDSVKVEQNVGGTVLNHALNRVVVKIVEQLNRRPPSSVN